jgi:hypothetical protein
MYREIKPIINPTNAEENTMEPSNQTGLILLRERWTRSVIIYGAFGRNRSQSPNRTSLMVNEEFGRSFTYLRANEKTSGRPARNRFHIRNRYIVS